MKGTHFWFLSSHQKLTTRLGRRRAPAGKRRSDVKHLPLVRRFPRLCRFLSSNKRGEERSRWIARRCTNFSPRRTSRETAVGFAGDSANLSWNLVTFTCENVVRRTRALRARRASLPTRNEGVRERKGFSPRKGSKSRCESQEGVSKRVLVPGRARRERYRSRNIVPFPSFYLNDRGARGGSGDRQNRSSLSLSLSLSESRATDIFSGEYRAIDCPSFPFYFAF